MYEGWTRLPKIFANILNEKVCELLILIVQRSTTNVEEKQYEMGQKDKNATSFHSIMCLNYKKIQLRNDFIMCGSWESIYISVCRNIMRNTAEYKTVEIGGRHHLS